MRNKLLFILLLSFLSSVFDANAQDIQFSQFYTNPSYENPAFTGSEHCERYTLQQRLQWPRLDAKYTTTYLSFDKFYFQYNSGIGVQLIQDFQGGAVQAEDDLGQQGFFDISTTQLQVNYAYELHFSKTQTFRAGFQAGYVYQMMESTNWLPSNFTHFGIKNGATPTNYSLRKGFLDLTMGGLYYGKHFYAGVASSHVNQPNQSFIGQVSRLPMKVSFVSGYRIQIGKQPKMAYLNQKHTKSITPTVHYKFQGQNDQVDFGLYGVYDQVIAGLWYRGIPMKRYKPDFQNHESIVFLMGWIYNQYKVGLSYDFIVSKLRPARSGGSYEISFSYIPCKREKRRKPMKRLPCPVPVI